MEVSAFAFDLSEILGEISTEEHAADRGMLSALVTHESGDMEPGPGFYALDGDLGYDVSTEAARLKVWADHLIPVLG